MIRVHRTRYNRTPKPLVAAVLATAVLLTGCTAPMPSAPGSASADTAPRALTVAESERLAVVRFNNYDSSPLSISGTVNDGTQTVSLVGYIDYASHLAYLRVVQPSAHASFLMVATLGEVGILDDPEPVSDPPPGAVPAGAWQFVALDPSSSTLAAALAVLINLGADRPENPQLLRQSSAQWLGETTIEKDEVTMISGPGDTTTSADQDSAFTYYVTDSGVLRRLDVRFGASGAASIDFGETAAVTLADPRSAND